MNTDFAIINFAMSLAHQSQFTSRDRMVGQPDPLTDEDPLNDVAEDQVSAYEEAKNIYDLYLEDLTNSRPWLYAHNILMADEFQMEPTEGIDLGYKFTYKLPPNVTDVLAVNIEENDKFRNIIPNTKQALRAGISYIPQIDGFPPKSEQGFVFVDEYLHSDTEIKSLFVKQTINIARCPASFTKYLAYTIAVVYADTLGQSSKRAQDLERKLPDLAMAAIRDEKSFKTNTHYATIINWISAYYDNAYFFGANSSRGNRY